MVIDIVKFETGHFRICKQMTNEVKASGENRTISRPDEIMPFKIHSRARIGHSKSSYPGLFPYNKFPLCGWIEIFLATLMISSLSISSVTANSNNDFRDDGICQRKYIRNNVEDLKRLDGCKVIEGSLQISLIDRGEPEHYKNLSFPHLREITGCLVLFQAKGLTTLRNIFPNLAVIRGQELLHSYALVITDMDQMQEIGLQSLTNIERGSVWIEGNTNLCYVDTIDWELIVNDTSSSDSSNLDSSNIYENKLSEQCPDTCPANCHQSEKDDRRLCWSNTHCQKVHSRDCKNKTCDGPCLPDGECCNPECLGGCNGTGPHQCFVCKHVYFKQKCQEACPGGFYEYLKRRCLTEEECLAVHTDRSGSPREVKGKLYRDKTGKLFCVLECPKETELSPNGTDCIPCDGACKKNCSGAVVETIDGAKKLAGCTRIVGALMIKIRGSGGRGLLVKELKENLDKIEEIDEYLIITYTYSISSLDFLVNLKRIRGIALEEGRYALVVKSNENLVELWNSTTNPNRVIRIDNKDARVLFHYNPKLCPNKIWEFVNQAGIVRPKDDKIDIGITNGDKVPCNTRRLAVEVRRKSNSSVTVQWENFRRNLTQTNHLLNYEVSYKETHEYPAKNVSIYDNRDPCGEDGWKVLDMPKMQDKEVQGKNQLEEPPWEDERIINGLKHFTWYALYVKTIVIPDETSPNNNTGAQSAPIYFQTLPDTPSKPREVFAKAKGPNTLKITWEPPLTPNGILESFKIYIKEWTNDQNFQDQRDYCTQGRPSKKDLTFNQLESYGSTSDKTTTSQTDKGCCSCSSPEFPPNTKKPRRDKTNQVKLKEDVYNALLDHVFVANPNFIPDNKTESNDVSRSGGRKRRRREIMQQAEESVSDSQEKLIFFPGENHYINHKQQVIDLEYVGSVPYNESQKSYQFILHNLTHYTTYTVGIEACRKPADSKDIENDTRTCSEIVRMTNVQTSISPTADDIDIKTVSTNVTGDKLHLRWAEPKRPNGVVMAYQVRVKKVGNTDPHALGSYERCVTRKKFQEEGRNFTFPVQLPPGKYSVEINVMSLARDSDFTSMLHFQIEENASSKDFWFWLLVILLPLLLLVGIIVLFIVYYFKNKGWTIGPVVISHNPEYMENVDIPDEWEVTRDQIELLKELGNGSFGMVFEGILKDFVPGFAKFRCAVKTVAEEANSEDRALFLKEAELMTKLHCYHLVKLIGVVSKTQPTYVVMELMAYGDLKNYLRARRPDSPYNKGEPPPTLKQILRIACEIADGMAYIHSHKLVHRDLAARNCMVTEDKSVKVGDFGMTKEVIQTDYYRKQTRGLLPVRWMAPESLHDGVFTNQTDIWSFGVVLWEMATLAAQPYQGLSNTQVLTYVQGGGTMERPDSCPEILFSLMLRCWEYDFRHRPTFVDILEELTKDLEPSFATVSFFYSREGQEFKYQCKNRPTNEEPITVRTPLRATMDDIDSDLDDYDSDEDHHLQGMMDDLNSSIPRRLLPTSPTMTTTGSMPTNTTTSMNNGLALNPLSSDSGQITNNNRPDEISPQTLPSSLSLQNTSNARIMQDISSPTRKPYSNSNNNYASTNPGGISGNVSDGFVSINLPNQTMISSAYTPNGVENVNPPNAKYTTNIPNSQSSGQINSSNRLVSNSGSSNSNSVTTPNSAPPGSNESSKALSIAYSSSDGSKVSNGGANVSLGGVMASAGPGTGGNGYVQVRHSPVSEAYPKINRTSQF